MRSILDDEEYRKYFGFISEDDDKCYEHAILDEYWESLCQEEEVYDEPDPDDELDQDDSETEHDENDPIWGTLPSLYEDCLDSFFQDQCDGECSTCQLSMEIATIKHDYIHTNHLEVDSESADGLIEILKGRVNPQSENMLCINYKGELFNISTIDVFANNDCVRIELTVGDKYRHDGNCEA